MNTTQTDDLALALREVLYYHGLRNGSSEDGQTIPSGSLTEEQYHDGMRRICSHAALLGALEDVLDNLPEIAGFGQDDLRDAVNKASQAIALGKGGDK